MTVECRQERALVCTSNAKWVTTGILIFVTGCNGTLQNTGDDGSSLHRHRADAGTTHDGGGRFADAGRLVVDASRAASDAGRTASDAGRAAVDAGRAAVDAGRPAVDAGSAMVDAGIASLDAGNDASVATDAGPIEADHIIPPDRRIDWSQAGILQGDGTQGIPVVPTSAANTCATLTSANTLSDINAAIAACHPTCTVNHCDPKIVLLGPGTYNLGGAITFNGSRGVILRGAGPDQTRLVFNTGDWASVYFNGGGQDTVDANLDSHFVSWSAPLAAAPRVAGSFAQASQVLTFASAPGFAVGSLVLLDQLNDSDVNGGGSEGCPYCSRQSGGRSQQQYVRVTAVEGNQVTISPGLHMPTWRASQSPQAFAFAGLTEMSGLEDLAVDNTNGGWQGSIGFLHAYNCWVKNVQSYYGSVSHVRTLEAARIEVRDSYFYGTHNAASQSYGVSMVGSSDNLVVNNMFEHVTSPIVVGPTSQGSVYAYNFMTDMFYTPVAGWMIASMATHAAHTSMNLFEGNFANAMSMDFIHGSSSYNTAFRNRIVGWERGKTMQTIPVYLESMNRYTNVVGNILGRAGYHASYENTCATPASGSTSLFVMGFFDTTESCDAHYDALTPNTVLRHGNYDFVRGSITWDPAIADHTLPASLYLSAKPDWFGASPWPPFDPASPGAADYTNLPAGARWHAMFPSRTISEAP